MKAKGKTVREEEYFNSFRYFDIETSNIFEIMKRMRKVYITAQYSYKHGYLQVYIIPKKEKEKWTSLITWG